MNLAEVARAASQRWWLIVISTAFAFGGAGLAYRMTPVYYEATVLLIPNDQLAGATARIEQQSQFDAEERSQQMATLMEMARSRAVCERASRKLGGLVSATSLREATEAFRLADSKLGRDTNLLQIRARAKVPALAVREANALATTFVGFCAEVSHLGAVANTQLLREQLRVAQSGLDNAESRLRMLKSSRRIVNLPAEQVSAVESLASLRSQRDTSAASLAEAQARLTARAAQVAATPRTLHKAGLAGESSASAMLRDQVAAMEKELAILRSRYTVKHPNVVVLAGKLERARGELSRVSGAGRQTASPNPAYSEATTQKMQNEIDLAALRSRVTMLDQMIGQRVQELAAYPGTDVDLERLALEYKTAEDAYAQTRARLDQARMNETLRAGAGAIRIIDPAVRAEGPFRRAPDVVQLLVAAVLLGAALGVAISLWAHSADRSLSTPADAARLAELPVIAAVPAFGGRNGESLATKAVLAEADSPQAQAFRSLAAHLMLYTDRREAQTIMVASARAEQGCTTVAANLAVALALAGNRVTLLDANLRRPGLHHFFGIENSSGLGNLLDCEYTCLLTARKTLVSNLELIPAGPLLVDPWVILTSRHFGALIAQLRNGNDFVIVDSPCGALYAEAMAVASVVDAAIQVVKANHTLSTAEVGLMGIAKQTRLNVLGVVFNGAVGDHMHYQQPNGRQRSSATLDSANAADAASQLHVPTTGGGLQKQ